MGFEYAHQRLDVPHKLLPNETLLLARGWILSSRFSQAKYTMTDDRQTEDY